VKDGDKYRINILEQKKIKNDTANHYQTKFLGYGYSIAGFKARQIIDSWLMYHDEFFPDKEAMFISEKKSRISIRRIQSMVKHYGEMVGINISPHSFRHYAASRMAAKYGIASAAVVLGHENITTTQRYISKKIINVTVGE
jgi:site-specific recombinase XerC